MKITTSDNYYHGNYECPMDDCERQYCSEHRLLWRECETAIPTHDGSGQPWFESQDCPYCMADYRLKKYDQLLQETK